MRTKFVYILTLFVLSSTLSFSQAKLTGKREYDMVYTLHSTSKAYKNRLDVKLSFNPKSIIDEVVKSLGEPDEYNGLGDDWANRNKVWNSTFLWKNVTYKKWSKNKLLIKIDAGELPMELKLDKKGNKIIDENGNPKLLIIPYLFISVTDDKQNDVLKSEYSNSKIKHYFNRIIRKIKKSQKKSLLSVK